MCRLNVHACFLAMKGGGVDRTKQGDPLAHAKIKCCAKRHLIESHPPAVAVSSPPPSLASDGHAIQQKLEGPSNSYPSIQATQPNLSWEVPAKATGSQLRLEGGIRDGDLHLYSRLDRDGRDLLHDLGGRVQVEDALVDAHLEAVPGVGSLAARGLARDDLQLLGGQAHGAGHLELLVHGALLQVRANCSKLSTTGRTRNK